MSEEKQAIDVGTVLSDVLVALGHVSLGMQGISHVFQLMASGADIKDLNPAIGRLDKNVEKLWENWEKIAKGMGEDD